jgi:hypothetical protein
MLWQKGVLQFFKVSHTPLPLTYRMGKEVENGSLPWLGAQVRPRPYVQNIVELADQGRGPRYGLVPTFRRAPGQVEGNPIR